MNNKKFTRLIVFLVVILIVAGTVSFVMCNDDSVEIEPIGTTGYIEEEESETTEADELAVHIVGCVVRPGVYYLKEGHIVNDVVMLAGGLTKNADVSVTNLAQRITDGMMITIYSKEQVANGQIKGNRSEGSLVNINTAEKEELMELPGIGESKAEAIISYRNKSGGFKDITEIMNISGIKEAVFNKIKDYITA